ncbi:MAG: type IV secretory system conjugative DNA transfer family protein [Planctomycetales bacterium]|nr:type IV secretory system conjugative DNA transfer family protein [Planctomycetales bacterium]
MRTLLTAPATNDRGPRYMERALAAIHQTSHERQSFTLEYGTREGRVGLFVQFSATIEELVTGPIAANYPNCSLTTVEDELCPAGWNTWSAELELVPELFPILRHSQFEDLLNGNFADPITGILRAILPDESVRSRIEIVVRPANHRRCHRAARAVKRLDREFFHWHHELARYYARHITRPRGWFPAWCLGLLAISTPPSHRSTLETSGSRLHDREDDLQAASDKIGGHLFETHIRLVVTAPEEQHRETLDRIRQMAGAFGAFTKSRLATFGVQHIRRGDPLPLSGRGFLLSHEELATIFHPPTSTAAAERMQTSEFTELEAPTKIYAGKEEGTVTIGRVRFRSDERLVGIGREDRRRHVYIVGSTGAGKSTLLLNLIHADMQAGRGLTVFDVHGDLADAVIRLVPRHRTNDVIVFDAASDMVVPFNPLACPDPERTDQVVSGVVSAFRKLFDSWGPRLENLLRYAVFVAVEQQGNLLTVLRLLTDGVFRDHAVPRIQDEVVRSFWQNEFAAWNGQYRTEAVSSVTNKVMPFLTNRRLRAITASESRYSLNLRDVMDRQQLLIINLSRGTLGQDNATLLGSLLLTALEQAAMTRAEMPEAERRDHYLYLDEFQSLTTPSTAIMLSESRKYRLCLTLSHQLTGQLDPATYLSVIGNCGTLVAFRVGSEDAELLAPAFSKFPGQLKPQDLLSLPNYTAYVRLLIDGTPSSPFSLSTLPPPLVEEDRREVVIRTSQRRHGQICAP